MPAGKKRQHAPGSARSKRGDTKVARSKSSPERDERDAQSLRASAELEEELKRSRDRYKELYNSAPISYLTLDCDGIIKDVNLTGARLLRGSRKSILGKPFSNWLVQDDRERFLAHLRFCQGKTAEGDIELSLDGRPGKKPLPVQLVSRRVDGLGGKQRPFFWIAIIDLSERRRSRRALGVLSWIVECSEDAIIGADPNGSIAIWNRGAEKIFGYKHAEVVGKRLSFLAAAERDGIDEITSRVQSGESVREFEVVARNKNGKPVHALWTASPFKAGDGRVAAISIIAHDVGKRKQAEEMLQTQRSRLEVSCSIAHMLSAARSIESVARGVLRTICKELNWDFGALWQTDERAEHLKAVGVWYAARNMRKFSKVTRASFFTKGEGITGRTWASGQPYWYPDCQKDRAFLRKNSARAAGLHTFLTLPLALGQERFGVLELFRKSRCERDEGLLQMLGTLCDHIAQFIRRTRAEEKLRQNEEHYRALVETAPGIAWISRPDGQWEYVSAQWKAVTGQSGARALESGWQKTLHSDDLRTFTAAWNHSVRTGKDFDAQARLRRDDGSYRWFVFRAVATRDAKRKILRWIGRSTDIDEQKMVAERTQFLLRFERQIRRLKEPDEILRQSVRLLCKHVEASRCGYIEVDEKHDSAVVRYDFTQGLPGFAGTYKVTKFFADTARVFRRGEPMVVEDAKKDPRTARSYQRVYKPLQVRAFMTAPLVKDGRWVAVMTVQCKGPRKWLPEEVSLLQTIADHTSLALENARLYREMEQQITIRREVQEDLRRAHLHLEAKVRQRTSDLRRANRELFQEVAERTRLEKEILEISERERRRFGEDLHDDLCQQLSGMALMSKALAQKLKAENTQSATEADKIAVLIAGAVEQARTLARGLHPVELDASGLTAALRDLARNLDPQVKCELNFPEPVPVTDRAIALHLYRIAQEATINALKHGAPQKVTIRLAHKGGTVILSIRDDGAGFRRSFPNAKGMGLHIMGYRARLIGGSLSINTKRGVGTTITCTVPQTATSLR